MVSVESLVRCLREVGVGFFVGVPDSLLKSFCAYVTDNCGENHVIAANEGGAVGLAAGHYLATGKPALVYMQNSGQGNAVNPLASLADPDVYSIPMVLLVGWRGEPGVKDEPQHVKQGKVPLSLFETLGIPTEVLPDDESEALELTRKMVERARSEKRPVALVVRKGLFAEYKLQNRVPDIAELKREDAIQGILSPLPDDAVVVSTTGMISREVYETRERLGQGHARDFRDTMGSDPIVSFAAVPVMFPCGCHCTYKGVCSNNCINEMVSKELDPLASPLSTLITKGAINTYGHRHIVMQTDKEDCFLNFLCRTIVVL